jgi:hypothetical protein
MQHCHCVPFEPFVGTSALPVQDTRQPCGTASLHFNTGCFALFSELCYGSLLAVCYCTWNLKRTVQSRQVALLRPGSIGTSSPSYSTRCSHVVPSSIPTISHWSVTPSPWHGRGIANIERFHTPQPPRLPLGVRACINWSRYLRLCFPLFLWPISVQSHVFGYSFSCSCSSCLGYQPVPVTYRIILQCNFKILNSCLVSSLFLVTILSWWHFVPVSSLKLLRVPCTMLMKCPDLVMFVCLSAWFNSAAGGPILMKFGIGIMPLGTALKLHLTVFYNQ